MTCGTVVVPYLHRKTCVVEKYCSNHCYLTSKERCEKHSECMTQKTERICRYCGSAYNGSRYNSIKDKAAGVCKSPGCILRQQQDRSKSLKEAHWIHRKDKEAITQKITEQRLVSMAGKTYIPWNKGKVGVYSPGTIQKIREAAIKQFHEKRIRKTNIEKKLEAALSELGTDFIYSFIYCKRQFDFCIPSKKILIEVHGDFWHGNPRVYGESCIKGPLREHQRMKQLDDKIKEELARQGGYSYVVFWEYDINHDFPAILQHLKELTK